jgi:O-antigen/teichoic acid export membrane protein
MLKKIHHYGGRFKGELLFMAANYFTPLVGFFSSLVATRYVEPVEMGGVQSAMLLLPYLSLLHFGAFTGLNRNLAYYLGKGDQVKAMRMVSASAFVAKLNSGLGLLFGCAFFIYQVTRPDPDLIVLVAGVAVTFTLICTPYVTHISATYRSGQHFKQFARVTWLDNGSRLIYCLLPVLIGWIGYVLSLAFQPIIRFFLLKSRAPYPVTKSFVRADLIELIQVGFPIMAAGYFATLLMVVDQSLVALFMGKEQLGYYTLARLVVQVMMVVPATLSIVLSPKVAACFGRTGQPGALRKYFWIILGVHIVFIVPICLIGYFAIGPLVEWLLPKYIPGIKVAQITLLTCLGCIFSALLVVTSSMRKNIIPIAFYGIALGVMWLIGFAMFKFGSPSIENIAWLRFYVALVLSAVIFVYTYVETGRRPVERV